MKPYHYILIILLLAFNSGMIMAQSEDYNPELPSEPQTENPFNPELPSEPQTENPFNPELPSEPQTENPFNPELPSEPQGEEPFNPELPSEPQGIVYYTVVFIGFDNIVLESQRVEEGKAAVAPTPPDVTGYVFACWDADFSIVLSDMTVNAQYDAIPSAKHKISWLNDNGDLLLEEEVEEGIVPVYNGITPTKLPDDQHTYTFAGWDKEIVMVTGDVTYTATYNSTLNQYTDTFKNEDGTVLDSRKWDYGTVPSCTEPTKPANPQYTYTFAGWSDGTQTYGIDDELPAVTADATYTARYEMKPVVAIEDVELYDNLTAAEYDALLDEYKDRDVNIILMRSFKADQYTTLCLPFELGDLEYTPLDGIVYEVTTATTDNINGLTLNFVGTSTMHLCYPYLIKPTKEMVNPRFEKVRLVSFDAQTVVAEGEDVEFRAIMNPVHLKTRTSIVLINNRLYYPRQTSGTNIRAFRAYFEILHPEKIDYVSARLKIEDSITDIPVIEGVEDEYHHTQTSSFKIFHNGILYILMPDGRMYDMQGAEVR